MLLAARTIAATQVTNLIAYRMRPDVLFDDDSIPAVTYEIVNTEHWHHLAGAAGQCQTRVQFNCYAKERETANKVAYAIRDVLDGFTGLLVHDANDPDSDRSYVSDCVTDNHYSRREPESPGSNNWRYRTVIDFVVSHTEPVPSLTLE